METYSDRHEAGKILAERLTKYANQRDVIVLALPRGGVPVAFEIANELFLPLDVFVVRKLGVPGQEELAMGALAAGGVVTFNESILRQFKISKEQIESVIKSELVELHRREKVFRGDEPFPVLTGKTIILVDDGIATGATIRVAIHALRQLKPAKIVVAVPVAAKDTCEEIKKLADEFVCPLQPTYFYAVGNWYQDFSQTLDIEVYDLLQKLK